MRQPASTSPCNEPGRGDIGNRFMVRLGSVVRRTLRRLSLAAFAGAALAAAAAPPAEAPPGSRTPPEHRRLPDQTFLTYPEWFLVHSPAEFADYLADRRPPSGFPFWGHVGQFWQGYAAVTRATADQPFNAGYHLMVTVIGSSTTVEYGLRAMYEGTIGRLAEATATHGPTAEERLAAREARDYVDFIRVDPWYLFDFGARLHELWFDVPWTGPDMIRKWERRFALTSEFGAKALYGKLIMWATHSIYDAPRPVTAVVLDAWPAADPALPEIERLGPVRGGVLVTIPRYEGFNRYAQALAAQGRHIDEVAGNRGPMLASLIVRSTAPALPAPAHVLFVQPILTHPGYERRVVTVPVPALAESLRAWAALPDTRIEHLYDF